jgi:hypothetical protein
MKVVVPYANEETDPVVHQAMMLNLQVQKVPAEWRRMKTDTSYAEYFNELWDLGEDFIIVEHDCFPWPGAIEELRDCPDVWCGFNTSLQTTKFSPRALGECPVSFDTHWQQVDKLFWTLQDIHPFHEHHPPVINLNRQAV